MSDTLILDPYGVPVTTMHWQDVITLYVKGRITVLVSDMDRVLRSPSFQIEMPLVVKLKMEFSRKQRRDVQFSKRNVAIRDDSKCQYCGRVLHDREYTYDHIRPVSRQGKSSWKNLVLCCLPCNMYKANRTPEEANMYLLKKPIAPNVNDVRFRHKLIVRKLKPEWEPWKKWLK